MIQPHTGDERARILAEMVVTVGGSIGLEWIFYCHLKGFDRTRTGSVVWRQFILEENVKDLDLATKRLRIKIFGSTRSCYQIFGIEKFSY